MRLLGFEFREYMEEWRAHFWMFTVSYFLFTATATTMVCTEYFRLIVFVFYGNIPLFNNEMSQNWSKFVNFDPRITRIVVVMAGVFVTCWVPVELAVFYYLNPTDPPSSERALRYMHYRIRLQWFSTVYYSIQNDKKKTHILAFLSFFFLYPIYINLSMLSILLLLYTKSFS